MALTTFVSGQVLTAQQLNDSFAAVGGLRLIKTQTIGTTVSTVAVTAAFSSTYDNYVITVNGGTASATGAIQLQLGSTTTGYYSGSARTVYSSGSTQFLTDNNAADWGYAGFHSANGNNMNVYLLSPNLATRTVYGQVTGQTTTTELFMASGGFLNDATQYTDFTLKTETGTFTGGTIRVYGYQNS